MPVKGRLHACALVFAGREDDAAEIGAADWVADDAHAVALAAVGDLRAFGGHAARELLATEYQAFVAPGGADEFLGILPRLLALLYRPAPTVVIAGGAVVLGDVAPAAARPAIEAFVVEALRLHGSGQRVPASS
jgi:hypothetical protein